MNTITYFELAFQNLWPSLNHIDLLCGIAGGVAVKLIIIYRTKNARKYRLGVEYGSARWGIEKDIRPYADPEFENNIILTETESLTMSSRPKNPKYARNKNILVIGGSGSGKTRFFVVSDRNHHCSTNTTRFLFFRKRVYFSGENQRKQTAQEKMERLKKLLNEKENCL